MEEDFQLKYTLYVPVPLSKWLAFAKMLDNETAIQELKLRAAAIEHNAPNAVINLVEVSQHVDLTELLEHQLVEGYVALFNYNGTYKKAHKSRLLQILYAIFSTAGILYFSH